MTRALPWLLLAACAAPTLDDATLAQRLAGFGAQEGCACRFVVGQSADACVAFAQSPIPDLPATAVQFDDDAGVTTAQVTLPKAAATRTARWRGPDDGCTLDAP
jgi:hypothetical protein